MRAIVVITVILLGVSSAAPEVEYGALAGRYLHAISGTAMSPLVEIESSARRGDRLAIAAAHVSQSARLAPDMASAVSLLAPAEVPLQDFASQQAPEASLDDLCKALLTSAQDNDLPVPFFANLIWQESQLRDDAVSPVGALGIAQFMPEVALESGLNDPFDPLQALPASARLLRALRAHFGNLGYVAAAYNAGAHRVSEWLSRGRALPRETLNYVISVTGRSAQQWRTTPPNDDALRFEQHLPCREMPGFAELEQAQIKQAQAEPPAAKPSPVVAKQAEPVRSTAAKTAHDPLRRIANRSRGHAHDGRKAIRLAVGERHDARHHAERAQHATHRA